MRVIAFESRRALEMATLIAKTGAQPFVAPSMREVELGDQPGVREFVRRAEGGEIDGLILLTGVGTRMLWRALEKVWPADRLRAAWQQFTLIVRGPKPSGVLRELGLTPQVTVPAPNTWRELVQAMAPRPERRLAVQEYGKPNPALVAALEAQGRQVWPFAVYAWDLPEDLDPLREAARRIAAGEGDAVLFTTSMQVVNLMRMGDPDSIREGLRGMVVGSIGPTTSETLAEYGVSVDFEPSQPKMGFLVHELRNVPRYNERLRP